MGYARLPVARNDRVGNEQAAFQRTMAAHARKMTAVQRPQSDQPLGDNGDFISISGHYNAEPQQLLRFDWPAQRPQHRVERSGPEHLPAEQGRPRLRHRQVPDQHRRYAGRCASRRHCGIDLRRALQPVEHGQHPRQLALHADRRPDPDRRSQLPVCEGQWRRHGDR